MKMTSKAGKKRKVERLGVRMTVELFQEFEEAMGDLPDQTKSDVIRDLVRQYIRNRHSDQGEILSLSLRKISHVTETGNDPDKERAIRAIMMALPNELLSYMYLRKCLELLDTEQLRGLIRSISAQLDELRNVIYP